MASRARRVAPQTDHHDHTDVVEADTATWSPARVAELYDIGNTWLHRAHPLTKLSAVLPLAVAGFVGDDAGVPVILLAVAVVTLVVSRLGIIALKSLRLMAPMTLALVIIHGVVRPYDSEPLAAWGPISVNAEGLALAGTTAARLAVFVIAVTAAMSTVHPKIFATALIQRGVSHKLAYAYLAGAELIPEMRRRATQILEAQQSRGFDTRGSLPRRLEDPFRIAQTTAGELPDRGRDEDPRPGVPRVLPARPADRGRRGPGAGEVAPEDIATGLDPAARAGGHLVNADGPPQATRRLTATFASFEDFTFTYDTASEPSLTGLTLELTCRPVHPDIRAFR